MSEHSTTLKFSGWKGWVDERLPIFSAMHHELNEYPTPKNLNYWWNFGSLAGITLVVMILTGLVLAMHYTADTKLAFQSVERIMRDVNSGWLVRYIHMNGASMFFLVVYIHMFRGLYYGSYKKPRELLWILGCLILLLMMATAFMGYVLPWGQMSFWGATVITNLFSAFPLIGEDIVTWLWGGFSVDNPTLTRFFALHFLLPFVIVGVVVLHIVALHKHGSNNPLGIDLKYKKDKIPFHPYYTIKDLYGLGLFALLWAGFVFFAPNYLGHPDNYIKADPMVTPAHIVPEWYFLPFYAILRAVTFDIPLPFGFVIDAKLGGVLAMFGAVAVLFVLPWLDKHPVRAATFRPLYKKAFWVFALVCLGLGQAGSLQPDQPFYFVFFGQHIDLILPTVVFAQAFTLFYFFFFVVLLPLLSRFEKTPPLPLSIATPVLGGSQ